MDESSKSVGDNDREVKGLFATVRHFWQRPQTASPGPQDSAKEPPAQVEGLKSVETKETAREDSVDRDELIHLLGVLSGVVTALWRANSKLSPQIQSELPSALRLLPRHLDAAWDALASGGITIQDHKDQRYVPGMAVNPLAFQPTEGVGCEVIQEVLKPSIYYRDVLIQRADVIVAVPAADPPTAPEPTDEQKNNSINA